MSGSFYESWPSEELRGIFNSILEQSYGGIPRYPGGDVKKLALTVYFRAFWTPVFELCHLVHGLGLTVQSNWRSYERFFWDHQPARRDKFHRYFAELDTRTAKDVLEVSNSSIRLLYGSSQKTIKFSEMPYLALVNEFCVEALGWVKLQEMLLPLLERDLKIEELKSISNHLCRQLYAYLKEHLPPVQEVRQIDLAVDFLKMKCSDDFETNDITDALVFEFWQTYSPHAEIDGTRTFSNAYGIFLSLLQALEKGEEAGRFANATPIGLDGEWGEVDLDREDIDLNDWMANEESPDEPAPLAFLAEAPAAGVKFLNKTETRQVSQSLERGDYIYHLLLSYMRMMVFGPAQGRIPSLLKEGKSPAAGPGSIEAAIESDYEKEVAAVEKLQRHLEKVQLASLYVLTLKDKESVDSAMGQGRYDFSVLSRAKKAFESINREGFRETDLERDEVVRGHKAAVPSLTSIAAHVSAHLRKLNSYGEWSTQFSADRGIFVRQFQAIYLQDGEL